MTLSKVIPILIASLLIAHASVLTTDAGNTQPGDLSTGCGVAPEGPCPAVEGTVDFAVYTNSNGSASPDPFGTGYATFKSTFTAGTSSGGFDATAKYLYVYETANNGNDNANYPVSQNTVFLQISQATSWGFFSGLGFALSSGVLGAPAGFSSPSPHVVGSNPTVSAQSGLIAPSSVQLTSSSIVANFGVSGLIANQISTLWGFTSNNPPVFVSTSIQDGGTSATGSAPTPNPTPEASSIYLTGAAGILVGLVSFWRRRLAHHV